MDNTQEIYNQVMDFLEKHTRNQFDDVVCMTRPWVNNNAVEQFIKTGAFPFGVICTYDLGIYYKRHETIPSWASVADEGDRMANNAVYHREAVLDGNFIKQGHIDSPSALSRVEIKEDVYKRYYDVGIPFEFDLKEVRVNPPKRLGLMIIDSARQATEDYLWGRMKDDIVKFTVPFWSGFVRGI